MGFDATMYHLKTQGGGWWKKCGPLLLFDGYNYKYLYRVFVQISQDGSKNACRPALGLLKKKVHHKMNAGISCIQGASGIDARFLKQI